MTITAYPLAWPQGWPRTKSENQNRGWQFKTLSYSTGRRELPTFARSRDALVEELRKLGATMPVISSNRPRPPAGGGIEQDRAACSRARDCYRSPHRSPQGRADRIGDGLMKGDLRCVEGTLYRHDPQHDDPDLETSVGACPDCSGDGCSDDGEPVPKPGRSDYWIRGARRTGDRS